MKPAMVEKRYLAVFIETCALGIAAGLEFYQLHAYSGIVLFLAFVRYQKNHRQTFFTWDNSRLCRGRLTF